MGYNTVAVLYNDHTHEIGKSGPVGARIRSAILGWSDRGRDRLATHFGCGQVISQEHADYSQVVIVGGNTGVRACDATDLDWYAIDQMAKCLERHGYTVKKKRKTRASLTPFPLPQQP